VNEFFRKFANKTSDAVGSPWAFMLAVLIIAVWAITGPLFGFSDTWQLVINTGTTIVTFLMVFLIQNTQNRDAKAIHLKLDELIRGVEGARTGMVDLEDMTDEELKKLQEEFKRIHERRKDEVGQAAEKADLVGDEVAHVGGRVEQVERDVRQIDEKVEARTGR
jgi:low affinity Fe/Cu permease